MRELTYYVLLYIWRRGRGEECKTSTESNEASCAEELVNKSSTVNVLEFGDNQGGKQKLSKHGRDFKS